MSDQAKACPWCRTEMEPVAQVLGSHIFHGKSRCPKCLAQGPVVTAKTIDEAYDAGMKAATRTQEPEGEALRVAVLRWVAVSRPKVYLGDPGEAANAWEQLEKAIGVKL